MQGPPPLPGLDLNYVINQAMPLIALAVIAVVGVVAVRVLSSTAIGDALAERIRRRTQRRAGGGDDERVAALEHQVAELQGQISELAERLDFAERMLAERRERELGAGQVTVRQDTEGSHGNL